MKDLLKAVDTPRGVSPSQASLTEALCPICLTKDRKVPLVDGKPCAHCAVERSPLTQYPASQSIPPYHDISPAYDQNPYHTDQGYFSRRSSVAENAYTSEFHHAPRPESRAHSPPFAFSIPPSSLSMLPSSLATPRHHPRQGYTAPRPRLNLSTTSNLTPAKIASNDRHKLSEKHRRDEMGAFVQAGDVLRKGINPGLLRNCSVCLADAAQESPRVSPTASPPSYSSIPNAMQGPSAAKPKKPKNNILEESLMWEFSWLLHMVPGEVARHLDGIRDVAAQMARDKEYGLRNDWAKRKKWDADVRSDVLEQALRFMEAESHRHGVDPWVTEDMPRSKKRRTEDVDGSVQRTVPTPPSSRSSPVFGRISPRQGSEDGEIDTRRVQ